MTKKFSDIVKHFVHDWIRVHGPTQKLFSDNGGEFNNDELRDMAENFNIEINNSWLQPMELLTFGATQSNTF